MIKATCITRMIYTPHEVILNLHISLSGEDAVYYLRLLELATDPVNKQSSKLIECLSNYGFTVIASKDVLNNQTHAIVCDPQAYDRLHDCLEDAEVIVNKYRDDLRLLSPMFKQVVDLCVEHKLVFEIGNARYLQPDDPILEMLPDFSLGEDLRYIVVPVHNKEWVVYDYDTETLNDLYAELNALVA